MRLLLVKRVSLRTMWRRSPGEDEVDDIHGIGNVDTACAVGVAEANRVWRSAAGKDIVDDKYGVGDVD